MRVADYIFRCLADRGVRHAFLVVGGGAMQLNDALRLEKRITPVCCHHEQACAIAAEGYFRASGELPVVSVTTGPGGTNALTGVIGAWLDSIPMIIVSGQVKYATTVASCPEVGLRQLGDQEINIIDVVRPVTKYAVMVKEASDIRYELEKAIYLACSGRPGPVWLDIPLNVQGAILEDGVSLASFVPDTTSGRLEYARVDDAVRLISSAKKPVVIAGHGIALGKCEREFLAFVEKFPMPVVTTFNGFTMLPSDHPLYFGRIGTIGQRRANFVLQNADLVVSLGSRNNIRQISYNWENFAPKAHKIVVDIDPRELQKPTVRPNVGIAGDVGAVIEELTRRLPGDFADRMVSWLQWCAGIRAKYPVHTAEQLVCEGGVNPYHATAVISKHCPQDAAVAIGNGTVSIAAFQTWNVKRGQRVFCNSGCASMGYDLPAAVGAAVATSRTTVCLAGDGSLMMNLQELVTVFHNRLPIKIFIFDNGGYTSIRQTQGNLFSKEFIGCDASSGVGFPDFAALCKSIGFKVTVVANHDELEEAVKVAFKRVGPEVIVVRIPETIGFSPKLSARRLPDGTMVSPSLEDMFPFLSREEMAENVCRL